MVVYTINKIKQENGIISAIYFIAKESITGSSTWVPASLFDGRTLRKLENMDIVKYNLIRSHVTLTEKGVGVKMFGWENSEKITEYL